MARLNLTTEQARDLLLRCLPPGALDLYDLDNRQSQISKFVAAIVAAFKVYGYDLTDTLRDELLASLSTAKLTDWEHALGVSETAISLAGTNAARRDQITSKLREFGPSTIANIQAAVQPFLHSTAPALIQIIECPRSSLTTTHSYALLAGAIPAGGSYTANPIVLDDAAVSQAGAQLDIALTHPSPADLTVTLFTPGGFSEAKVAPFGTAGVVAQSFRLYFLAVAGQNVGGVWTVEIADAGAAGGAVGATSSLFVEGVGRPAMGGGDGLGSAIFQWAVFCDSTLMGSGFDVEGAFAATRRLNPAHCIGGILLDSSVVPGSPGIIPSEPTSIPMRGVPMV